MPLDGWLSDRRSEVARHVAKRRDAQRLCGELELRMPANRLGHRSRQADVVRDHSAISGGADVSQGQPYLESTEAAGVLRAVVHVVGRPLLEVIIGRVIRERGA